MKHRKVFKITKIKTMSAKSFFIKNDFVSNR